MGVVLNVDPSAWNVLTDVFLLMMQMTWVWLMDGLYRMHLKRSLRLGERIYSYEPFGTLARFRWGASKVKTMRDQDLLGSRERKSFRYQSFIAVMSFLFANLVLPLHILIDQGLDFQRTDPTLASTAKVYDMVEVYPDDSFAVNLDAYSNLDNAVRTCISTERNIQKCRRDAQVFKESILTNTMNSIAFAKKFFDSSSVTGMDIVESLEFQYRTWLKSNPSYDEGDRLCQLKNSTNLNDFYGSLEFEPDNLCIERSSHCRAVSIDLRATQTETSVPIGTQTGRTARLGGLEVVKTNKILTYRQFKDEYQLPSKVSITSEDGFLNEREKARGARLSVDSRVVYHNRQKQTMLIADLSRGEYEVPHDPLFAVGLRTFSLLRDEGQGELLCPRELKGREGIDYLHLEEKLSVLYEGSICGDFTLRGVLDVCSHQTRAYDTGSGTTREQKFGFQLAEMTLLMDETNECRQFAEKVYAKQIPSHKEKAPFALLMAVQLSIVCTANADSSSRIDCALGGEDLYWSPEQGFRDGSRSGIIGREPISLDHRNRVGWVLLQIEGGDVEATTGAFKVIQQFFQDHYPTFRVLVSRGVSKGRFLGHQLFYSSRDTLFAISTQLRARESIVQEYRAKDVAVLNITYFLGLAFVVMTNVVAACILAIRYWQEYRAYRHIYLETTIPNTTTAWIMQAVRNSSKFPHDKGFAYAVTYECDLHLIGKDPDGDHGELSRKKLSQEGFLTFSDHAKFESKERDFD